jgi:hypothetical protein
MSSKVQEVTAALADLDFNVSDEEISLARKIWTETDPKFDYLQTKTVTHPMYVV